jgi:two-component system, NtrC family, sensor kinase
MGAKPKFRLGLTAKLALPVIACTTAFFTSFGYINLRTEQRQSENLVEQAADTVAGSIARGTHTEMLKNDRDALHNRIDEFGVEPGIETIRLFNPQGLITHSTDPKEIGKRVDLPLQALDQHRARRFTDSQGRAVLAVMQPIRNAPECWNAQCHVHPASQKVLGGIDADLSLAGVEGQIRQNQAALTWFLVAAIVFGCAASIVFMWVVVYRPVRELIDGTHRVAGGDLNYRLPVRSDDELGDLAASFNKMTAELAGVQAKIEEQVRRKTAELEKVYSGAGTVAQDAAEH